MDIRLETERFPLSDQREANDPSVLVVNNITGVRFRVARGLDFSGAMTNSDPKKYKARITAAPWDHAHPSRLGLEEAA